MRRRQAPFLGKLDPRKTIRAICGLVTVGLFCGASPGEATDRTRSPNIVFILSDNQRSDFMGCSGHPFVLTPHLDRLAEEGILFTHAFVTTSLCGPSRASFLTGQTARTHGVRDNLTPWDEESLTFLEVLGGAGYESAFIGKWHMPGRLPGLRGVDLFVTFTIQKGQGRYFDCPLVVDGVETPSRRPYITEELTDYAIEFISKPRKAPFCLVLSHKAVHHRWLPPPDLADMYATRTPPFPPEYHPLVFITGGNLFEGLIGRPNELYRDYARVVTALDREIGRLLASIDRLGLADDTVVVFASDNGFFWGEHQRGGTGRWPYEESIRIPFIVRAPGFVEGPGRRADQMILNIDLAPSLLEMAGLPAPESMEGRSFVPALNSGSSPGRRAWLYEYQADFPFRVPSSHAVRTKQHIYIEFEGRRGCELYNLQEDPRQRINLIHSDEGREIARGLKAMLEDLKDGREP